MSYQYYDRGGPHGVPENDMRPTPGRRPPPPGNYHAPSDRPRGPPPPVRPGHTGGPPPGVRYPARPPPPQEYSGPPTMESTDSLYDGSAYGGAEYDEAEQWPLPARPFAQSGRSGSPGGSPKGSPRRPPPPSQSPVSNSPRRPPQRPQRPDFQEPILDQPRPGPRIAPANKAYHQPPPPQNHPHHGPGQWTGDGYRSPQPPPPPPPPQDIPGAAPQPQHPSMSHPDYQMPQALQQTLYGQRNQRPPLGPPPSSRRGPPSYYPQIPQVHPIVEETDSMRGSIRNASMAFDPAHSSYASSNAIPIGVPSYYVEDRGSARSLPYEQQGRPSMDHGRPSADHIRPSMENSYDELPIEPIQENMAEDRYMYDGVESPSPEPAALIRQASLGKKSKPTLTTVKSNERVKKESANHRPPPTTRPITTLTNSSSLLDKETFTLRPSISSMSSDEDDDEKAFEAGDLPTPTPAPLAVLEKAKTATTRQWSSESGVLSSGSGFSEPFDLDLEHEQAPRKKSSRELLTAALPKEQLNRSQPRSPLAPIDPNADPTRLQQHGASTPTELDDLAGGKKRPPRLDIDAVRDAEVRGSLTSLPDLIRRATKVASNLDRGRTASRLGMNFFVDGTQDASAQRGTENRKSGDINEMLASFPPPQGRFGSPPGSRGGVSLSRWSSNLRHSHLPSDSDAGEAVRRRKGRRCCGMPLWLFISLLIILLLLVAAAVLVPVILLIILPGQRSEVSAGPVTAKSISGCMSELSCANGGVNMLSGDGFCQCICTNGFTGRTCEMESEAACTTITVGTTRDATVGSAIPSLSEGAEANFGIALDLQTLLGLFSSADMACSDENALVTLASMQQRRSTPSPVRRRASSTTSSADPATTSDGLLVNSSSPGSNADSTEDFAKVAILYVLQDSTKPAMAVQAHDKLNTYFGAETSAGHTVSLGNGYSCDLQAQTVTLADGTLVGGA